MADARIQVVADVLTAHGHNSTATGLTTDDLAAAIVGALTEHAATADDDADGGDDTGELAAADVPAPNPETPAGTGTEGGASAGR